MVRSAPQRSQVMYVHSFDRSTVRESLAQVSEQYLIW